MLRSFRNNKDQWHANGALSDGVIWIDLVDTTEDEKVLVQQITGKRVPDEDALSEIEASSRLILEDNVLYLSSPAVKRDANGQRALTSIGFIVDRDLLVTVRFSPSAIFDRIEERVERDQGLTTGMYVFTAILEAIVDRGADVLEQLGAETDRLSRSVFRDDMAVRDKPMKATARLRKALTNVGIMADRLAMARDTLLGAGRIASFTNDVAQEWITPNSKLRLAAVLKDVSSLSDYGTRVSDKIQLLLDAVLGFINIEQNNLFKILTIVSVVGVPPTLLAGIWGMNFKNMPELNWAWGYAFAWLVILISGLLPLAWFKARGWFD